MKTFTVIITAGGIGSRMGATIPKQFLEISGKPLLFHTLERFHKLDPSAEILLTLPLDWQSYWDELIQQHKFSVPHHVVNGGEHRYDSVRNAVMVAQGHFIAIHDGVRPFVSNETLQRCWEAVRESEAVIPVLNLKDSVREIREQRSQAVDRSLYRLVQTPQCFSKEILVQAYKIPFNPTLTDDATLVEQMGVEIQLVDGNEENIKITTPFDLLLAEEIAKNSGK
jgi:2-C-methyl-D-erythritol 4-phosphate cytidylyltransferase